jgi:hypothetical protein
MGSPDIDRALREGLDGWNRDDLDRLAWLREAETELVWSRLGASQWLDAARSCSYFVEAEPKARVRLPGAAAKSLTFSPSAPLSLWAVQDERDNYVSSPALPTLAWVSASERRKRASVGAGRGR